MIIKVIKGQDLKAAIRYNTQKVNEGHAEVLSTHNLPIQGTEDTKLIERMMRSFASPIKEMNTNIKNYVFHGVISPEEKDLSDKMLTDLAKDYMAQMGYANQPYFVVKHHDTDHTHIHIVSIDTDVRGKRCVNDSNTFRKTSEIRKNLEQKYNLTSPQKSKKEQEKQSVENAMKFVSETSFLENDIPTKDYKNNIQRVLRKVRNDYKVTNFYELDKVLNQFGIKSEIIPDYEGITFYSIDNAGKQTGKAIAGSKFVLSYKAWIKQFETNEKYIARQSNRMKVCKDHIRWATDQLFKKYAGKITYGDYKAELKKHGIDAQFNVNDDGLLIGITFVDHGRGQFLKASDVDKTLSKDLKERLVDGGVDESPEIKQIKKLTLAMEKLFHKRVEEQFEFNSTAIRVLEFEKTTYISHCKEKYDAKSIDLEYAWDKFYADKQSQLETERKMEYESFEKRTTSFLKIVDVIDPQKRQEFMIAYGFSYVDGKLSDSRRPSDLYLELEDSRIPIVPATDNTNEKLSKAELEFYNNAAQAGVDNLRYNWMNPNDYTFRFLSPEDKRKAQTKMIMDRFADIMANANNADDILMKALYNGMLIEKRGDDVMLFCPNTNIQLSVSDESVRKMVMSNEYENFISVAKARMLTRNGKTSLLFQAVQKFNQVYDSSFKQEERLLKVCDWMASYNSQMASDLRQLVSSHKSQDEICSYMFSHLNANLGFKNYERYMKERVEKGRGVKL